MSEPADDILGDAIGEEETDFLIDDILDLDQAHTLETDYMPSARSHRISTRRRFARLRQKQALRKIMPRLPAPGESLHAVGPGQHDFFTFIPEVIALMGRVDRLTCSTWTINHPNAVELIEIWDRGLIGTVDFLTGDYFKARETGIYTMLVNALRRRGGRYRAFMNHAKLLMFGSEERDTWVTITASANLTANPRMEIFVIINDRALYDFHRSWIEEVFTQ